MVNSTLLASVARGGSTPFCVSSAATDVTDVNVATCDSRTPPSSLPSNMRPMSIGCLSCQMAVLESREVASSRAASSSLESPASFLAASYREWSGRARCVPAATGAPLPLRPVS